jgi:hypothetical protein
LSQIQKEPGLLDSHRHIFGSKRASKNTRWRCKQTAERDRFCFLYLRPLYYLPENKDIPGSPKASQKIM